MLPHPVPASSTDLQSQVKKNKLHAHECKHTHTHTGEGTKCELAQTSPLLKCTNVNYMSNYYCYYKVFYVILHTKHKLLNARETWDDVAQGST